MGDMKIVLDTDVIVAGFRSTTGASRQILTCLDAKHFEAPANVSLMIEYEAILKRADNLDAVQLTSADIDRFINALALKITPVKTFYLWRPMLRDPDDEFVLEAAVNGGADAIVTFNIKDFELARKMFGLEIIKPAEMLRRIKRWQM